MQCKTNAAITINNCIFTGCVQKQILFLQGFITLPPQLHARLPGGTYVPVGMYKSYMLATEKHILTFYYFALHLSLYNVKAVSFINRDRFDIFYKSMETHSHLLYMVSLRFKRFNIPFPFTPIFSLGAFIFVRSPMLIILSMLPESYSSNIQANKNQIFDQA